MFGARHRPKLGAFMCTSVVLLAVNAVLKYESGDTC